MGKLTVRRQKGGWRDLLRAYSVEIDGEIVGKIKRGQTFEAQLSSGSHTVRLTIDWCSSKTLKVEGDGDTVLHCAPGGTALTALPDIVIDTAHYIILERALPSSAIH